MNAEDFLSAEDFLGSSDAPAAEDFLSAEDFLGDGAPSARRGGTRAEAKHFVAGGTGDPASMPLPKGVKPSAAGGGRGVVNPLPAMARTADSPYADKREAIDDAVDRIEMGARPEDVFKSFEGIGVSRQEIEARGAELGGKAFRKDTRPVTVREGATGGTVKGFEPSAAEEVVNTAKRGKLQAEGILDAGAFLAGATDAPTLAEQTRERTRRLQAAAPSGEVAEGIAMLSEANKAGSLTDVAKAIFTRQGIKGLAAIVAESTVPSLMAAHVAAAGSLLGPAGTAAGAGAASFAMEFASALGDELDNRGADPSDPMAVRKLLEDPEFMRGVRERGVARGIPVATFDAVSAGFAGRFIRSLDKAMEAGTVARPGLARAGALAKESGMQAGAGVLGELGGQAAVGEYKPLDAIVEGVAEVPGGLIEAAGNVRDARATAAQSPEAQFARAFEQDTSDRFFQNKDIDGFARAAMTPGSVLTSPNAVRPEDTRVPRAEDMPTEPLKPEEVAAIRAEADAKKAQAAAAAGIDPTTGQPPAAAVPPQGAAATQPAATPAQQPTVGVSAVPQGDLASRAKAAAGTQQAAVAEINQRYEQKRSAYENKAAQLNEQAARFEAQAAEFKAVGANLQFQRASKRAAEARAKANDIAAAATQFPTLKEPPPGPELEQFNVIAQAMQEQFGSPVFAYVDDTQAASDGFRDDEVGTFVNLSNPEQNVLFTTLHEFKHAMRGAAKAGNTNAKNAEAMLDSVWGMISDEGKREYAEKYLFKARLKFGDVTLDQLMADQKYMNILREEMIADFMGKRATDREFMIGLAKREPKLFGDFIKSWIEALDGLIAKLRGSRGPGIKDIDRYIDQLEQAKRIAEDVMIEWQRAGGSQNGKSSGAPMASLREDNELGAFNPFMNDEKIEGGWSDDKDKKPKATNDASLTFPSISESKLDAARPKPSAEQRRRFSNAAVDAITDIANHKGITFDEVLRRYEFANEDDYLELAKQVLSDEPKAGGVEAKELSDEELSALKEEIGAEGFGISINGQRVTPPTPVYENPDDAPGPRATVDFGETTDRAIQSAGLLAESAFPAIQYRRIGYDYVGTVKIGPSVVETRITAPEKLKGYSTPFSVPAGAIERGAREGGAMPIGTPLTNFSTTTMENGVSKPKPLSYANSKKLAGIYTASAELFRRKFDLARAVPKGATERVLDAWQRIAKLPKAFEFGKLKPNMAMRGRVGEKSLSILGFADDVKRIGDEMLAGTKYTIETGKSESYSSGVKLTITDTSSGKSGTADIEFVKEGKYFRFHTAQFDKGSSMGKVFYQVAAAATDKFGDYPVLSDDVLLGVNNFRRTEQMMSAAARAGTSISMRPGIGQRIYGWNFKAKTDEQRDQNFARLALAGARNVAEVFPEIQDIRYDIASDRFTFRGGESAEDVVAAALKDEFARATSMSRATFSRAAITFAAIEGDLDLNGVTEVAKPVLYSSRISDEPEAAEANEPNVIAPENERAVDAASMDVEEPLWLSKKQATLDALAQLPAGVKPVWSASKGLFEIFDSQGKVIASGKKIVTTVQNYKALFPSSVAAPKYTSMTPEAAGEMVSDVVAMMEEDKQTGVSDALVSNANEAVDFMTKNGLYPDWSEKYKSYAIKKNGFSTMLSNGSTLVIAVNNYIGKKAAGKLPTQLAPITAATPAAQPVPKAMTPNKPLTQTAEKIKALFEQYNKFPFEPAGPTKLNYAGIPYDAIIEPPDTPEFKAWAQGNVVVDSDGKMPLFFHGTAQTFYIFTPKQAGAIFGSRSFDFAYTFSSMSASWMAGKGLGMKVNRKVLAMWMKATKPWDYTKPEHVNEVIAYLKAMPFQDVKAGMLKGTYGFSIDGLLQLSIHLEDGNWKAIEAPPVQAAIKALGYDAFYMRESGEKNLAVYSNDQIKLAMMNVGSFGQRPVTDEEAALFGMTAEEANALQSQGDIRFSAREQPTYASRPVANAKDIARWAKEQGFTNVVPPERMHVTVAYSRTPVDPDSVGNTVGSVAATGGRREVKELAGGAIVLSFENKQLQDRWQAWRDAGASWDYESYQPHVTITYDAAGVDLENVRPYAGPIILGPETNEPLKLSADEDLKPAPSNAKRMGQFTLSEFGPVSKTIEYVQDRYNRWKQAVDQVRKQGGKVTEDNDFYIAEERYWSRVGAQIEGFKTDVEKWIEEVSKDGLRVEDVSRYAYAEHAKDRNRWIAAQRATMPDGGSGMTDQEAQDILDTAKAAGLDAVLGKHSAKLRAWVQGTRDVLLKNGLITQDEYDNWTLNMQSYVPLRGLPPDTDIPAKSGSGTGQGFNVRGNESKRAMGRRSEAKQIVENIIADRTRALIRSGKNEVLRHFLKFVLDNPSPNLWEVNAVETKPVSRLDANGDRVIEEDQRIVSDDRTVTIKDGGNEVHITVRDEVLRRQLQNLNSENIGKVIGAMLFVNRILSRLYTSLSPVFAVINPIRDAMSATFGAIDELGFVGAGRMLANMPRSAIESFKAEAGNFSPDYQLFRNFGGKTGFFDFKTIDDLSKEIASLSKKSDMKSYDPRKLAPKTLELIESFSSGFENMTRLAIFKAARESGRSLAEASRIAKNVTVNFNRRGAGTPALSAWFLFFNPAVQGTTRMLQALASPKVVATLGAAMTGMFALAIRNASMGADDDDIPWWDKIPPEVKERNIIIVLPPGSTAGEEVPGSKVGRYVKIPMPYGYNFFAVVANQVADVYRNRQDAAHGVEPGKAFARSFGAFMGSWVPIAEIGGSFENPKTGALVFTPDSLNPIVQNILNVNPFGREIRPEGPANEGVPNSQLAFPAQQGTLYQRAAQAANSMTGGDEITSGFLDISPGSMENLVRGYLGGPASFAADIANSIYARTALERPEFEARRLPFAKQFYGVIDDETDRQVAYSRMTEAQAVSNKINLAKKLEADGARDKLMAENPMADRIGQTLIATRQRLSTFRKEELAIIADASLTDGQKIAQLNNLNRDRREVLQQFNLAYNDMLRAMRESKQQPPKKP